MAARLNKGQQWSKIDISTGLSREKGVKNEKSGHRRGRTVADWRIHR